MEHIKMRNEEWQQSEHLAHFFSIRENDETGDPIGVTVHTKSGMETEHRKTWKHMRLSSILSLSFFWA